MAVVVIELPDGEGVIRGGDGEIELTHDIPGIVANVFSLGTGVSRFV